MRYGVSEDRITVTTNAADSRRFYPGEDGGAQLQKYGLISKNYFLTVGRLEPRKNHVNLFKAYAALGPEAAPLVVVGQRDFGFEDMFEVIAQAKLEHRVMFLSDVADDDLPIFYRHCLAFVYPSLAEGFGMPPLEAMACGAPVIVANNTALTEVVGSAGELVDALDVEGLTASLGRMLHDSEFRCLVSKSGLLQAQKFSWDVAAKKVAARYRAIAAEMCK